MSNAQDTETTTLFAKLFADYKGSYDPLKEAYGRAVAGLMIELENKMREEKVGKEDAKEPCGRPRPSYLCLEDITKPVGELWGIIALCAGSLTMWKYAFPEHLIRLSEKNGYEEILKHIRTGQHVPTHVEPVGTPEDEIIEMLPEDLQPHAYEYSRLLAEPTKDLDQFLKKYIDVKEPGPKNSASDNREFEEIIRSDKPSESTMTMLKNLAARYEKGLQLRESLLRDADGDQTSGV